jgi:hypothetical protein
MGNDVKLLGILNIVYGVLGMLGALVVGLALMIPATIGGMAVRYADSFHPAACWVMSLLGILALIIGGFLAIFSLADIIGGIGLLQGKSWARMVIVVMSFLHLIFFPFGTALGVYGIWVLLGKEKPGGVTTEAVANSQ